LLPQQRQKKKIEKYQKNNIEIEYKLFVFVTKGVAPI
jgi:hypothetical protein